MLKTLMLAAAFAVVSIPASANHLALEPLVEGVTRPLTGSICLNAAEPMAVLTTLAETGDMTQAVAVYEGFLRAGLCRNIRQPILATPVALIAEQGTSSVIEIVVDDTSYYLLTRAVMFVPAGDPA